MVRILPLMLLICLASGCIPYPDRMAARYGVKATLINSVTSKSLANTNVTVAVDGDSFARRTDGYGSLSTPPRWKWYWTWPICGPILVHCEDTTVCITAPEHEPFRIEARDSRHAEPDKSPSPRIVDGYLLLGNLRLRPLNQANAGR